MTLDEAEAGIGRWVVYRADVPSPTGLRDLAKRLDSQAAISSRPGQMEELEWIASRLRVWANNLDRWTRR